VYRGLTSNFNSALLLKETSHTFWYDKIETTTRYYYWIRMVSVNGTEGELIGPATAVAKPTIAGMIEFLTGQIDAGLLATALKEKIDYIDVLANGLAAEVTDRENGETTFAEAIADVQAGIAEAHTFIFNETETRTTEYGALVDQITGVAATAGDALIAATETITGYIDTQHGIAMAAIDAVVGTIGGDIASVIEAMSVQISTLEDSVDDPITGIAATNTRINALYTVKLTVNDLVGGFGLANDGHVVEAGFDVDTFWVGRTQANKRKPFIIADGVVYLDEAVINSLQFSKLKNESGSFVVSSGKLNSTYVDPASEWLNSNQQWADVTGTGKPADGATVGAPAGTYVGSNLAQDLETLAGAQAKANAAAEAAVNAAAIAAQTKADLAETTAKAYADGIVTAEEERAILDATNKANAARIAAEAAAALDATAKANVAATTANWSGVSGKPSFGAFATLNQITSVDVSTYIAAAAIDYTRIGVLQAANLSIVALSDTINGGVNSGAHIEATNNRMSGYASSGAERWRLSA
jgi:hypothetical protein